MADHDQFFKKLLKTFFPDLVAITEPGFVPGLRLDDALFMEQELFTDVLEGNKHLADLVARVPLREEGSSLILTHIEVQGKGSATMGARMWRYNMQLQLREDVPVLPMVVYLKGGRAGIHWETHEVKVLDKTICQFNYLSFGLSRSRAEDYLAREEPLAWGLAALMKHARGRVWLKIECLRRILKGKMNDLQRRQLLDCVNQYVKLKKDEQESYETLLEQDENKEVKAMEMTWSEKIEARGEARGRRAIVKELLAERFGPLPDRAVNRLEAIESISAMEELAKRLLRASSLKELGLD